MDPNREFLAKDQANFCHILGNTQRVLIVWILGNQQLSVGEIAEEIGASLQNTSQHLRLMKDRGILDSNKEGRKVYYWIVDNQHSKQCPVIQRNRLPQPNPFIRSFKMAEENLEQIMAAETVDARAMACPGPLLEAKKSIGKVKVGEILELWSGDPGTKNDMPRWCAKVGHEYLGEVKADGYDRMFIRRNK